MKRNNRGRKIFSYFLLAVGAFIFILPYLYMIVASTQNNAQIIGGGVNFKIGSSFMDNLHWLLERYDYVRVIINSIIIAVVSTILATISSTMVGYALAKYKFRGGKLLFNTIMVSRMVPFFTTLIPLFYIMSRMGMTNTYMGIIIPSIASTTSAFMMKQYASQFPTSLMEAARIDGASEWMIFRKIAVPILMPSIVTTGLLVFMGSWNQYLYPLVMLTRGEMYTVPLVIKNITTSSTGDPINYGGIMFVLATSVIPMVLIYMIGQAKFKATDLDAADK